MSVLYRITNRVDGKRYIGVAVCAQKRWREHRHRARSGGGFKLHAAMRKHGIENFEMQVIATLPTDEEAKIAERIAIAIETPEYNLTAGGEGVRATPEVRAKISAKSAGRKPSPETVAKLRAARLAQGYIPPPTFTPEHRAKMRAAQLGKKQSEETKAKRSAALKRAYAEGRRTTHFKTGRRGPDGRCLPKDP